MSNVVPRGAYPWVVGSFAAVLAVASVDLVYTLSSSGGISLVPWWLAWPFGIVVAWRAAVFRSRVDGGTERGHTPALEGFVLMAGSAFSYLSYNVLVAHIEGSEPSGWGLGFWALATGYILFYTVPVGLFGAFVGHLLGVVVALFPLPTSDRIRPDVPDVDAA